jgi:hypothetical protein
LMKRGSRTSRPSEEQFAYLPTGLRRVCIGHILFYRRALIVGRIVDQEGDRSVQDNSAIARIAQRDLGPEVLVLIERHADNKDAIFFLGRLVWQGDMSDCVAPLLKIAANPELDVYARMVSSNTKKNGQLTNSNINKSARQRKKTDPAGPPASRPIQIAFATRQACNQVISVAISIGCGANLMGRVL